MLNNFGFAEFAQNQESPKSRQAMNFNNSSMVTAQNFHEDSKQGFAPDLEDHFDIHKDSAAN